MVICIVALIVFSILSIFSARYRKLTSEAFNCVFRMVTFRPCTTKLDQKIKTKLTSKLMKIPSLARFIYKNFTLLSWIFTIVFFLSLGYSAHGLYNLVVHGTCDPSGNCPFNTKAPVCGCEGICQCEEKACNSPEYLACKGNCSCQKEVCRIK